jgi:hypothetical protein
MGSSARVNSRPTELMRPVNFRFWPFAAFAGDENIANSMTAIYRVADVHQG